MVGKDEFESFNLESLKFLMHFREPGSSLYFIYIIHIYFYFLIYIYSFFFLSFSFLFLFAPLEL
jgi:hypothetical protein